MVTELLVSYITSIISAIGYSGILILMALESMIAPVPSEAVMPFAGFLAANGRFDLWLVIAASSIGSVVGSLISYYIGYYGGKPLVLKFGKYLLLEEKHLDYTTNFFQRYGARTIFFSRFIPVVRHLISIPAGIGKMPLKRFLIFTFAGATIWNSFLAYLGLKLGENWTRISNYSRPLDAIVIALIVIVVIVYLVKLKKKAAAV